MILPSVTQRGDTMSTKDYECISPLRHGGRAYAVGEKIPAKVFTPEQATYLLTTTPQVLREVKQMTTKELKTHEKKEVETPDTPDLQGFNVVEAAELIENQGSVEVLERMRMQEEAGKKRVMVLGAIRRRIEAL